MRVRAEVSNPPLLGATHDHGPRKLLVERHGEIRIALVVAVANVEAGVELLDPGVLELECLDLGAHHGPLDPGGARDHRQRARMQRIEVLEIGVQPGSQALRLADIQDPSSRVAEPVHARLVGDRAGRRSICGRVRHNPQPYAGPFQLLSSCDGPRVRSARPGRPRWQHPRPAAVPAPGHPGPNRLRWNTGCHDTDT